ncbi:hypothetical protein [Occultella gossypii]|uniref:Uncharacterized protein n=1 Tax=Occultella gossypii TaxID=2800820 RepID=A0ABS7SJG5_9MICO|nr:hypothetical protein [Occultella gossypii]MBZ2199433.1 hypothetical protein [Occultella gossypii]
MANSLYLVIAVLAVGVVALVLGLRARVSVRDVEWLAGKQAVPAAEAEVYRRYLQRHRRHRIVGASIGAILHVSIGLPYEQRLVLIGAGDVGPLADLFFSVVTGAVIGALSAETYRLRQPRSTVAAASLAPRAPVAPPGVVRAARILTCAVLLWTIGSFCVTGYPGGLHLAAFGTALAIVAEATRYAVTARRRPVRSARAVEVDSRIRAFAGETVSWLQLTAATLVVAWLLAPPQVPDESPWNVLLRVLSVGGLIVSVVLLLRAAPRQRQRPRRRQRAPLVAPVGVS